MINIWIIWTWNIAWNRHLPAITKCEKVKLTAILTRDYFTGLEFIRKHDLEGVEIFTNIEEFATSSIDAVIISSPDGLHYHHGMECLENYKHVLMEKPLCTSIVEWEALVDLSIANNVFLMTWFHLRHHDWHQLLHKIIQSWELWTIRHVRALWAWPQEDDSNWRAHENLAKWWALWAVWSHCFDLSRWMCNYFDDWKHFKSLTSQTLWNWPHEESAIIIAESSNNTTFELTCSVKFWPYNSFEIFWDRGTASCLNTFWRNGGWDIFLNGEKLTFTQSNPFLNQLNFFVWCIENKSLPMINGIRNIKDLSLID